jgi:hypothetical protein
MEESSMTKKIEPSGSLGPVKSKLNSESRNMRRLWRAFFRVGIKLIQVERKIKEVVIPLYTMLDPITIVQKVDSQVLNPAIMRFNENVTDLFNGFP